MQLDKSALAAKYRENYTLDDLMRLVAVLRAPDGCPWDREQTHLSIRANFIEETYEALEAIDTGNLTLLREELGDVLLQICLHVEMEREQGNLTMDSVITDLCRKLIIRHPHVFGDLSADNAEQALSSWETAKRETKGYTTHTESLRSIPASFPALMRAQKIQSRAKKAGFDWPDVTGALDKLEEEIAELREAITKGQQAQMDEELGDLLFSAVNAARLLGFEAELALSGTCEKFVRRFAAMEQLSISRGSSLGALTLEQMDKLWDQVKLEETQAGRL